MRGGGRGPERQVRAHLGELCGGTAWNGSLLRTSRSVVEIQLSSTCPHPRHVDVLAAKAFSLPATKCEHRVAYTRSDTTYTRYPPFCLLSLQAMTRASYGRAQDQPHSSIRDFEDGVSLQPTPSWRAACLLRHEQQNQRQPSHQPTGSSQSLEISTRTVKTLLDDREMSHSTVSASQGDLAWARLRTAGSRAFSKGF